MKRCFYFAGIALLGLASCAQEDIQPVQGDGNVNLTISLPGSEFGTRSFSDGKTALDLEYAVYDVKNDFIMADKATFPADALSTTVSLQLANGRAYKIAFFAHNADQGVYKFEGNKKSVTVDYTKMSDYNATDYDCFYKLEDIETVTGPISKTIILKRPMAQINWGTNDLANPFVVAPDAYGADAVNLVTKVSIDKVYSSFDLISGNVTGAAQTVTFPVKARPDASTETFPIESDTYKYLSMQYVLVDGSENTLVEATLTPSRTGEGAFTGQPVVVSNLPIQRNYRTNIYGALLTSPAEFIVTKDQNFVNGSGDADHNVEYIQKPVSSFNTTTFDPEKSYKFTGSVDAQGKPTEKIEFSAEKSVTAAGIAFENVELDMSYPMTATTDRFEMKNVAITGVKAQDAKANPTINVNNVKAIDIDGITFDRQDAYNGLEIGLSQTTSDLKNVTIKNVDWKNANHNAICLYTVADGAVINIEDSKFDNSKGGVPVRLANASYAKNVTINLKNIERTPANNTRCDNVIIWMQDYSSFTAMTSANRTAGYFEEVNTLPTWTINIDNVKVDGTAVSSTTNKFTTSMNDNQTSIIGFAVNNIGSKKVDGTQWLNNQHAVTNSNAILLEGFGMDLVINDKMMPKIVVK